MKEKSFDNSLILIDKHEGITSFQIIAALRRLLSVKKAGHSGTLDKFASGLLIVSTGYATKLSRFFLESDKRYRGIIRLGITTDTCDREGRIIERKKSGALTIEDIRRTIKKYRGRISQIPPLYSSLKIKGKRASELVRKGMPVELKPRNVEIYSFEVLGYDSVKSEIGIDVRCSKGTYIRSLARDIGNDLGCGAHLSSLRRIESGKFKIENAATIDEIKEFLKGGNIEKKFFIDPAAALDDFSSIVINNNARRRILNGAFFAKEDILEIETGVLNKFKILDLENNLIALADINREEWAVKYLNIFNSAAGE